MEEIRQKSRNKQQDVRSNVRSKLINSKRLHWNDEDNGESHKYDKQQVHSLVAELKRSKCERVLKNLKAAFAQGDDLPREFFKCDGALHSLIGLLICRTTSLQLESAACLINLCAAGDHETTYAAAKLAVPYLVLYLQGSDANLQELSAWALGNIASDCSTCCGLLKSQNFSQSIMNLLAKSTSPDATYSALHALKCYMSHCQPEEWGEIIAFDSKRLYQLLQSPPTELVLVEISNILFYLSTSSVFDEFLMQSGCIELTLEHLKEIVLKSGNADNNLCLTKLHCQIVTFLIRVIAGVSCNPGISQKILNSIELVVLSRLLKSNYLHIHKETLWMFNNLACYKFEGNSPWMNDQLLRSIVDRLLGPEELVQEVLIFFNHLLRNNHWPSTIRPFSEFLLEDTLVRLLSSNSHAVIKLVLNLLNVINDKGYEINCSYSENLATTLKHLQEERGNFSDFGLALL